MNINTINILKNNNYVLNKRGLIYYLIENNKLDNIKLTYNLHGMDFVNYIYNKFTIKQLEEMC